MAHTPRLDRLATILGVGAQMDERALIQQALAEIDLLYGPGLVAASHPLHHAIVGAFAQADRNGGRIPRDTPYLGETLEALAIRDARVTLPPPEPEPAFEPRRVSAPDKPQQQRPAPPPAQAPVAAPRVPTPTQQQPGASDWTWDLDETPLEAQAMPHAHARTFDQLVADVRAAQQQQNERRH
jgi:hypothetical protein